MLYIFLLFIIMPVLLIQYANMWHYYGGENDEFVFSLLLCCWFVRSGSPARQLGQLSPPQFIQYCRPVIGSSDICFNAVSIQIYVYIGIINQRHYQLKTTSSFMPQQQDGWPVDEKEDCTCIINNSYIYYKIKLVSITGY